MMEFMKTKVCHLCGKAKGLDAFSPDYRIKDGLQSRCKECRRYWMSRPVPAKLAPITARLKEAFQANDMVLCWQELLQALPANNSVNRAAMYKALKLLGVTRRWSEWINNWEWVMPG
jgi:hypothetical protein